MPKKNQSHVDPSLASGNSPTSPTFRTPVVVSVAYAPEDTISAETVAAWLRPDVPAADGVAWLREKVRRRCSNPIPCRNVGRALLFSKIEITNWLQSLERLKHSAHPRRTKKQIEFAKSQRAARRKAAA